MSTSCQKIIQFCSPKITEQLIDLPNEISRQILISEKEYLEQMKKLYEKVKTQEEYSEKVDVNGIKISKKLLNRESLKSCPVCGVFPKKSMDDVCLTKFDCCYKCYIQYVEGREERWLTGWRPDNENF